MKVLWTLAKVALALVFLVPLGLLALGVFGAILGIGILLLRLALMGLLIYGGVKLVGRLFRGPEKQVKAPQAERLASPDRYYQDAMRELDREIA